MRIMLIMSASLFCAYLIYFCGRYGLPRSLSATYYTSFGKKTLVPLLVVLALIFGYIGITRGEGIEKSLSFLSAASLAFVAATPQSRDNFIGRIHLGAALVATIGSQALAIKLYPIALGLWFLFPILVLLRRNSAVLWAELICFSTLFISFLNSYDYL